MKTKTKTAAISWKALIVAIIVAFLLNTFISAAAGIEPRKNITWTVFWIYLSIEAWKSWKWKALLPYPLYFVLTIISLSVVAATDSNYLSWTHISVALFLNIGGLLTFYLLLRRTQNNDEINDESISTVAKEFIKKEESPTPNPACLNGHIQTEIEPKNQTSEKFNIDPVSEVGGSIQKMENNVPDNLKSNKRKLLMKIFKLLSLLVIIILIIFFSVGGYLYYKETILPEKKMLSFGTDIKWEWYDKYNKIQINTTYYKLPMLRKVYLEEEYVIYVYKDKDYILNAFVNFYTDCKPNTEIKTSQKWSDGTHKKLKCDEKGTLLSYSVTWSGKNTDLTWEENLDGFNFRENFTYWDFTKLDQRITLLNAE